MTFFKCFTTPSHDYTISLYVVKTLLCNYRILISVSTVLFVVFSYINASNIISVCTVLIVVFCLYHMYYNIERVSINKKKTCHVQLTYIYYMLQHAPLLYDLMGGGGQGWFSETLTLYQNMFSYILEHVQSILDQLVFFPPYSRLARLQELYFCHSKFLIW